MPKLPFKDRIDLLKDASEGSARHEVVMATVSQAIDRLPLTLEQALDVMAPVIISVAGVARAEALGFSVEDVALCDAEDRIISRCAEAKNLEVVTGDIVLEWLATPAGRKYARKVGYLPEEESTDVH